ncbi:MAG: site-specific DNA-methyltransferase [Sphingobacteriales bacterium]|jgi:adenine-specific DNA-methyltransferase|nr:site-specific DNA-methyltransferase [Sphingobacteriales bacterium]
MPTLNFKGKTFVQNHHLAVKYHQLVPKAELSLTDPAYGGTGTVSLHDNLIVQGDNLKALKALLPTYAGKVKCIYIDPPYNTGNENWVYNDNVNSPMIKEWLGSVVDKEDMTRHDKWLCLMMPRLKLLRELLSEDGAIFISCDDNEQHNLRVLLDEIFGENNFKANFIWNHRKSSQNDIDVSLSHNYTICYAKNIEQFRLNPLGIKDDKFSNPDNDPKGDWVADPMDAPGIRENLSYEIVNPNTNSIFLPPKDRHWRFTKEKFEEALAENRIVFGKTGKSKPQYKRYKFEAEEKGTNPFTIWTDVDTATGATQELMQLFDGEKIFNTPKPTALLKRIIHLATNENDIILDSFAGSGTTAHAVLELNKEDASTGSAQGGNRKFILVEQEDYANTITAERIRRVIKGVPTPKSELLKKGTGGTFSYFELGETIEMESLLRGENLPSFTEFARYLFYTATGEEFDEKNIDTKTGFIGESKNYEVFLFYKDDIEWLKQNALTLDLCKGLPKFKSKQRLIFAPAKYVDDYTLLEHRIDFCQLPYEIYRMQK